MSLWVKICGITTVADAELAVAAGADAIGINLWPGSPRCVDEATAARIAAAVRGQVLRVSVTVDVPVPELRALWSRLQLDWLQLHGHEPDAWVADLAPYAYRAVGLGDAADVARALAVPGDWVLVDARDAVRLGGTGHTPPEALAAQVCQRRRTLLAGGLGPENVARAVTRLRPAGVDATSRLEAALGRKDPHKVRDFVQAARAAFNQISPASGGASHV